ncbi:MAG: TraB/VirB10 family protein [Aquificota bacterium]|nr:TraB/VirB10 family protein [Aquificota bacterium]
MLLNGLDAPTLQYGRENPHPVLILLTDKSILANNRKLNLKGCFVHASGWGELSSERAYLELISISLHKRTEDIRKEGKGTVVDADGKTGLKGRVVSKFGSVLAKQFMEGLLEGIGNILRASSLLFRFPVGTLESIQPEDVTKVAVAGGFLFRRKEACGVLRSACKRVLPGYRGAGRTEGIGSLLRRAQT